MSSRADFHANSCIVVSVVVGGAVERCYAVVVVFIGKKSGWALLHAGLAQRITKASSGQIRALADTVAGGRVRVEPICALKHASVT